MRSPNKQHRQLGEHGIVAVVFLSFFTLTVLAGIASRTHEQQQFDAETLQKTARIAQLSQQKLDMLTRALERMAKRWQSADGTPVDLWRADAQEYFHDFPFLRDPQPQTCSS